MAKRIFRNMVLTVLLAVLFTAILIVPTLYHAHESSMSRQLRQEADIIAETLEIAEDDIGYLTDFSFLLPEKGFPPIFRCKYNVISTIPFGIC